MRVLVLTNLYPPRHLGGYELACQDVVDGLRLRGHAVEVLTSSFGLAKPGDEGHVHRRLTVHSPGGTHRISVPTALVTSTRNRRIVRRFSRWFSPHVVLVFNPSWLGGGVVHWLHRQAVPVVHDVSDVGLLSVYSADAWLEWALRRPGKGARGRVKAGLQTLLRRLGQIPPAPIDLSRSYFRSQFLKEHFVSRGLDARGAPVIHHGVRRSDFADSEISERRTGIVFSGRLIPAKGVDLLVEAIVLARESIPAEHRTLTLIGPEVDPAYSARLREIAARGRPELRVEFSGFRTREEAVAIVRRRAVFAFPVLWDEPFSIGLIEAMAGGAAIVATLTGGTTEILQPGSNCLAVDRADAPGLASTIVHVLEDAQLRARLGAAARTTAARFDLEQSIDRIERHLHDVVAAGGAGLGARPAPEGGQRETGPQAR